MHLHFDIDDPRWAVVLAGALRIARTGSHKEMNPPFTTSFEQGKDPLIDYIARSFDKKPADAQPYTLPNPDQYAFIDFFQASTSAKTLFEQHGIKQDPIVVPLYLHTLASNSILLTHGIVSKPAYYVPVPSKAELDSAPDSDAIIELPSMEETAKVFCEGLGIENPRVICCQDYNSRDMAIATFKTNAIVARPHHYIQYVIRSQYTGFDNLNSNPPVLALIDETCQHDNRFLVSWNGQLPMPMSEPPETVRHRGIAWKIRQKYNFDHRAFYRDIAAGKVEP